MCLDARDWNKKLCLIKSNVLMYVTYVLALDKSIKNLRHGRLPRGNCALTQLVVP